MAQSKSKTKKPRRPRAAKQLLPGERLSQVEFHRRYCATTTNDVFELVDGVVYQKPRNSFDHGTLVARLCGLLFEYQANTPLVEGLLNVSLILGQKCEIQADCAMILKPRYGGISRVVDGYLTGGAELVVEVADKANQLDVVAKPTALIDLGVQEYLFLGIGNHVVRNFQYLPGFDEAPDPPDGIWRSCSFPGLCLDTRALFEGDSKRALMTLHRGLADVERRLWIDQKEADLRLSIQRR